MTIAVVSGGFDPIHSGHLKMIEDAATMGDVVVLVNSDEWLARKKGKPFMSMDERVAIVSALKHVTAVYRFDDSDGSCKAGLEFVKQRYPNDKIL